MKDMAMPDYAVRELQPQEYPDWDRFVDSSINGTIFHSSNWLTLNASYFGHRLMIIGCFKDNELIAGCSLFLNNLKFWKRANSTEIMTPYGGIVIGNQGTDSARINVFKNVDIIASLDDFLDSTGFRNIDITCSPEFVDIRPFTWRGWQSSVLYTYYLDRGATFETFARDRRQFIKRAKNEGVRVERRLDAKLHYEMIKNVYTQRGLQPPVDIHFFERVMDKFRETNQIDMWIAETSDGVPISSDVILADKTTSYLWSGGSDPEFKRLNGPLVAIYEAFMATKDKGHDRLNMMQGNIYRFSKWVSGFNPILVPYYRVYKSDTAQRAWNLVHSMRKRDSFSD